MRTNSFIFTADVNSAADMQQIEMLRNSIKSINKMDKETDRVNAYYWEKFSAVYTHAPRYRVSLKARGARRVHAIADGKSKYAYDDVLPLKHAERIDVYVHAR